MDYETALMCFCWYVVGIMCGFESRNYKRKVVPNYVDKLEAEIKVLKHDLANSENNVALYATLCKKLEAKIDNKA